MRLRAVPISSTDRSAVVLLFDDQTERRRLQDQLIQSEKMSAIGQLIAGIAHDLNNPLASVVGFADYPDRGAQRTAVAPGAADGHPGGGRARVEHRQEPAELRPEAGAPAPAHRAEAAARRHLPAAAQQSHGASGGGRRSRWSPTCRCRTSTPTRSSRSSSICINNAAQAIASTGRPGPRGGPRPALARRRGDRRDRRRAGHVRGAGRPGVRAVLHHQARGRGHRARALDQPGHREGARRPHHARPPRRAGARPSPCSCRSLPSRRRPRPTSGSGCRPRRLRVLVVDDEPHILHYMRATLEAWGHIPVVASDGARSAGRGRPTSSFDLVISDLRMPRLGGREFYEELARRRPELAARLVFSTGDTVRGDTLAFLEIARPPLPAQAVQPRRAPQPPRGGGSGRRRLRPPPRQQAAGSAAGVVTPRRRPRRVRPRVARRAASGVAARPGAAACRSRRPGGRDRRRPPSSPSDCSGTASGCTRSNGGRARPPGAAPPSCARFGQAPPCSTPTTRTP